MQSKKIIIISVVAVILVGAGAFYGGMIYEQNTLTNQGLLREANRMDGGNFTGGQIGQQGQQGQRRGQGAGQGMMGANGGGFVAGEILSKDDNSITIKTRDGGSKIVFFSDSTLIGKMAEGSIADLNVGQQVTVNGKSGSDGSVSAQDIQIRPELTK